MSWDLKQVHRNGDRGILEVLVERGDTLTLARHTIVFFNLWKGETRNPELVVNPLALRATRSGWRVCGQDKSGLTIENECFVDPENVNRMSDQMSSWAEEFGVEFDGWECAVLVGGDTGK